MVGGITDHFVDDPLIGVEIIGEAGVAVESHNIQNIIYERN